MTTNSGPPVTWFKVLMLMGATIGLCVGINWTLLAVHGNRPHEESASKEEVVKLNKAIDQLGGMLGNLSSSNAGAVEQMKGLRRDLDRFERVVERLEEKMP